MKKEKKVIATLIIVLLIMIITMLSYAKRIRKKDFEEKSYHDLSNILSYKNSVIDVYKGEVKASEISTKTRIVFESYIPSINDNIVGKTDSELAQFFDKDLERIIYNLGINKKEEFIVFCKKLQNLNCDLNEFKELTYLDDSYIYAEEGEYIEFKIEYDNGEYLKCKLLIKNVGTKTEFKFELL